jgi:hypothetical protein
LGPAWKELRVCRVEGWAAVVVLDGYVADPDGYDESAAGLDAVLLAVVAGEGSLAGLDPPAVAHRGIPITRAGGLIGDR